jgi:hypothetical protein
MEVSTVKIIMQLVEDHQSVNGATPNLARRIIELTVRHRRRELRVLENKAILFLTRQVRRRMQWGFRKEAI